MVNPLTNRSIKIDGPTFKALEKDCAKYNGTTTLELKPEDKFAHVLTKGTPSDLKAFFEDDANASVNPSSEIKGNSERWPWLLIISNKKRSLQDNLEMLHILHKELLKTLSLNNVIDLYKQKYNSFGYFTLWGAGMTGNKQLAATYFICDVWPVDLLAKTKIGTEDLILNFLKSSHFDLVEILIKRKLPINNQNNLALWASHLGAVNAYVLLVKELAANPNARNTDGTTPLWFYLGRAKMMATINETTLQSMLDVGAIPYASRFTNEAKKEITFVDNAFSELKPYIAVWKIINRKIFPIFHKDLDQISKSNVHVSSDVIALTLFEYLLKAQDKTVTTAYDISGETRFNLQNNLYLTTGILDPLWKPNVSSHTMDPQSIEILGFPSFMHVPKAAWTKEEMLAELKVKVVKVGEYKHETRAFNVYEIQLHHDRLNRVVGVIGNYIPLLVKEHRSAAPALTDPKVLEKALNKLHAKRQLLVKTFPYRSKLDLLMYDFLTIDSLKLGHQGANINPILYQNKSGYLNMLLSVDAALRKERYIPTHVQGVVKKSFTTTFMDTLAKSKMKVQPENLATIAENMQKSLSKSKTTKSASPKVDLKPLLVEALTTRPSKSKKTVNVLSKVQAKSGPIYSLEHVEGIPKTIVAQVETEAAKRKKALTIIATFAKKRVSKLTKYFEDSMAYMDGLPKTIRSTIYRAVTGNIMQGPYSPIKRIGPGLLYAAQSNARDVFTMVEVVMRAPRFPMRYTLFRGMALPETPVPGETEVFQEIPFSTTFISNYATGWILAKKGSSCCLLEVVCHAGTGGLFLSKLPWMDPWTSMNASIFQRIAPDNAKARFHIKVNSQNEFLMQPYRLKVIEVRKKNFKNMMAEQLEKLDTHYEYDASQRGLDSLFKSNEHLLDKEIDVYRVQLEPISLYAISIENRSSLQPWQFGAKEMTKYHTLFYSPEELEKDPVLNKKLHDIIKNDKYIVTKLIEKGRYVGPRTF